MIASSPQMPVSIQSKTPKIRQNKEILEPPPSVEYFILPAEFQSNQAEIQPSVETI